MHVKVLNKNFSQRSCRIVRHVGIRVRDQSAFSPRVSFVGRGRDIALGLSGGCRGGSTVQHAQHRRNRLLCCCRSKDGYCTCSGVDVHAVRVCVQSWGCAPECSWPMRLSQRSTLLALECCGCPVILPWARTWAMPLSCNKQTATCPPLYVTMCAVATGAR